MGSGCQAASCGPARGSRSPPLSLSLPYLHHALIFIPLTFLSPCRKQYGLNLITLPHQLPSTSPWLIFDSIPTWNPPQVAPSNLPHLGADTSVPPSPYHHQLVRLPGGRIGKHTLLGSIQLPHLLFLFFLAPWGPGGLPSPLPKERAWAASYLGPQGVGGATHVGWGRDQRAKAWTVEIGISWPTGAYEQDRERQG